MKKKFTALALGLAVAVATILTGAPAEARPGGVGGYIVNVSSSSCYMAVAGNLVWKDGKWKLLSPIRYLAPGNNSKSAGISDADAFRTCSTGKTYRKVGVGPGARWTLLAKNTVYKVPDYTYAEIKTVG